MSFVDLLDVHCKGKYPREFGHKTKRSFIRNEYATNAEHLAKMCEFFRYKDCYASVYTFTDFEPGEMWNRDSVIIDRIYIDLDHESKLHLTLKEARKIVSWYSKTFGVYPLVYFTGCRGFAIYLDFKPIKFENATTAKNAIRTVVSIIADFLKLKTIDFQVVDVARLSRLPLTINTKTGHYCIPLNPSKLDKLTIQDIIHMSKLKIYHIPEINEAPNLHNVVKKAPEIMPDTPTHNVRITMNTNCANHNSIIQMILNAPNAHTLPKYLLQRAIYYTKVAIEKGALSKDPLIVKIHSKSKWFANLAKKGNTTGAVEHLARVHFVLLLITIGLSDEQIHTIFQHFEDYNYEKTQYFINYNRQVLKSKNQKCFSLS